MAFGGNHQNGQHKASSTRHQRVPYVQSYIRERSASRRLGYHCTERWSVGGVCHHWLTGFDTNFRANVTTDSGNASCPAEGRTAEQTRFVRQALSFAVLWIQYPHATGENKRLKIKAFLRCHTASVLKQTKAGCLFQVMGKTQRRQFSVIPIRGVIVHDIHGSLQLGSQFAAISIWHGKQFVLKLFTVKTVNANKFGRALRQSKASKPCVLQ